MSEFRSLHPIAAVKREFSSFEYQPLPEIPGLSNNEAGIFPTPRHKLRPLLKPVKHHTRRSVRPKAASKVRTIPDISSITNDEKLVSAHQVLGREVPSITHPEPDNISKEPERDVEGLRHQQNSNSFISRVINFFSLGNHNDHQKEDNLPTSTAPRGPPGPMTEDLTIEDLDCDYIAPTREGKGQLILKVEPPLPITRKGRSKGSLISSRVSDRQDFHMRRRTSFTKIFNSLKF